MRPSVSGLVLLGSIAACQDNLPEPIWRGEHLHYSTLTSEPVCRGSFYRQERHAVELARLLGFELSDVIQFTRLSPADIPEFCGGLDAHGCAWVGLANAFAADSFQFHEISHVVADLGGLTGPRPFTEGFAEVFSDGAAPTILGTPLSQALRDPDLTLRDYHTMARFARFLIERHGLDPVAEFMRLTPRAFTFDEFAPVFADSFGEPIDAAMAAFSDYPNCSDRNNRIAIIDCNLPPAPWDDRTLTLTAKVTCDQDDVLGPRTNDEMFTTRSFEIEEAGDYLMSASEPDGWSDLRIIRCGSCWDAMELPITPGTTTHHELTPGRYYAMFTRQVDEPAELDLVFERLTP